MSETNIYKNADIGTCPDRLQVTIHDRNLLQCVASTLFRRGQQDSQLQDAASLKFQEVHVVARLFSGKSHHLAILHSLSLARQNMMVIHIQPNGTLPVTGASPRIIWCTTSGDEFTIVLLRLTIWKMRWQFFMLFKIPPELPV